MFDLITACTECHAPWPKTTLTQSFELVQCTFSLSRGFFPSRIEKFIKLFRLPFFARKFLLLALTQHSYALLSKAPSLTRKGKFSDNLSFIKQNKCCAVTALLNETTNEVSIMIRFKRNRIATPTNCPHVGRQTGATSEAKLVFLCNVLAVDPKLGDFSYTKCFSLYFRLYRWAFLYYWVSNNYSVQNTFLPQFPSLSQFE